MKIAVYPGSFDPITKGHLDIIERASRTFDKVIVAVMYNKSKKPLFSHEERKLLIEQCTTHLSNVSVDTHEGLLVDYLKRHDIKILVKGLRAISDFESEFQMASVNQKLYPEMETVFIMTRTEYMYLSSSIVKEIATFSGDISGFVTQTVQDAVLKKMEGRV